MHFTKMHGIGNDFIVVDCLGPQGAALAEEAEARAAALNDRKFGIGGDGVILVLPSTQAPFRMRMFNPDGSEAEMCGNGIRCFAKFVVDRGLWTGSGDIPVETGAGLLHLSCQFGPDGKVATVRVDMGEPHLRPNEIPTLLGEGSDRVIAQPLTIGDQTLSVTCVSMGNPHAIIFVDNVREFPVAVVGPQVEIHAAFPRRTNTEFIQVRSESEIDFRVWERGAAETLACGTGACAAAVACVLNGETGRAVRVHLPGGDLDIVWSVEDNHVYMTGPAAVVFEGEI
jgi:diaminopimelate epimerase